MLAERDQGSEVKSWAIRREEDFGLQTIEGS